jgi:hypothetical protein
MYVVIKNVIYLLKTYYGRIKKLHLVQALIIFSLIYSTLNCDVVLV